jgi:hypothetical protein
MTIILSSFSAEQKKKLFRNGIRFLEGVDSKSFLSNLLRFESIPTFYLRRLE